MRVIPSKDSTRNTSRHVYVGHGEGLLHSRAAGDASIGA